MKKAFAFLYLLFMTELENVLSVHHFNDKYQSQVLASVLKISDTEIMRNDDLLGMILQVQYLVQV